MSELSKEEAAILRQPDMVKFLALMKKAVEGALEQAGDRVIVLSVFYASGGGSKVVLGDDNYREARGKE